MASERSNVWTSMHARWRLWHDMAHWRGKPGRCPECGGRVDDDLDGVAPGCGVTIHLPGCTREEAPRV